MDTNQSVESNRMHPPSLPGPCVSVPNIRNQVQSYDGEIQWEVKTHKVEGLDLDGHGSDVILVPSTEPGLRPNNMNWTIYLMHGECGHELGVIYGLDDPFQDPGESHGLRNIAVIIPASIEEKRGARANLILTRYSFDGRRYTPGKHERR